jgi:hypothetical protein
MGVTQHFALPVEPADESMLSGSGAGKRTGLALFLPLLVLAMNRRPCRLYRIRDEEDDP